MNDAKPCYAENAAEQRRRKRKEKMKTLI